MTFSVDYEAFYSDEISIKTLGPWRYCQEQSLDSIYLVTIHGADLEFCGLPVEAPWDRIAGQHWVSHNAAFDRLVFDRLVELGLDIDRHRPSGWDCTANLSVYMGAPRSLKGAAKALLKKEASKDYRKVVKSKLPSDLTPEEWQQALDAGRQDARLAYEIWETFSPQWPIAERELSELTIQMGHRGVYIDRSRVADGIKHLRHLMWEADQDIPWAGELDEKGNEVARLSLPKLAEYCRNQGIPAPSSVAQDSEECEEWLDRYGEEHKAVLACRTWRRCNALLKKLEAMAIRVQPNGRMGYGLKYFGAHTGRWSGDTGWNIQNLPKTELFGVDLRACIIPEPGKKFIIADLAQIEPRVEAWIVGDLDFLELCAQGQSPYEAHARSSMEWTGGKLKLEDAQTYATAKARVLALGFGAGFLKFIKMVKKYGIDPEKLFGERPVTEEETDNFYKWLGKVDNKEWLHLWDEADDHQRRIYVNSWLMVMDYRRSNPKIVDLWDRLNTLFKQSVKDGRFIMTLPSGRSLTYRQISCAGGAWTAQVEIGGARKNFYGGKLTENLVQATARDVFARAKLRVSQAGYPIVASIHDEIVVEVDLSETTDKVSSIMQEPVPWLPGCPIGVEAVETMKYTKE
jgi:DNA polymerase